MPCSTCPGLNSPSTSARSCSASDLTTHVAERVRGAIVLCPGHGPDDRAKRTHMPLSDARSCRFRADSNECAWIPGAVLNPVVLDGSIPSGSVDALPHQVGMPAVPGVLLDHMQHQRPDIDRHLPV